MRGAGVTASCRDRSFQGRRLCHLGLLFLVMASERGRRLPYSARLNARGCLYDSANHNHFWLGVSYLGNDPRPEQSKAQCERKKSHLLHQRRDDARHATANSETGTYVAGSMTLHNAKSSEICVELTPLWAKGEAALNFSRILFQLVLPNLFSQALLLLTLLPTLPRKIPLPTRLPRTILQSTLLPRTILFP
jgi:hypothetical protein